MFQKFTDNARRVVALASQEAQRLNHNYLGPEHLLLALVKEGSGVGATVLHQLGWDLRKIRGEVEKRSPTGPDTTPIGKIPHNPQLKKIIENAVAYALKLGSEHVGTEHLLYGLTQIDNGVVANLFQEHGLTKLIQEELSTFLSSIPGSGVVKDSTEKATTITSQTKNDYWLIPRGSMDLSKVIESYGFTIVKDSEGVPRICGGVNPEQPLGLIKSGNPTLVYSLDNLTQISDVLKLREVLSRNNQQYTEEPPLRQVYEEVKSPVLQQVTLLSRIEKLLE